MTRPRKGSERTEAGKAPRAADGAAGRGARTGALVPLALAAILAAGFALRMMPGWRDPALELLSDAAYHARLVAETERAGRLPKLDLLSESPAGRVTAERLPTGFYSAAAAYYRATQSVGARSSAASAMAFVALTGALIAVPVYFASRALSHRPAAALLGALAAAILPAHVHRSFGYWLRPESLGTLLAAAHVALSLHALRPGAKRAGLAAVLSSAALFAALAVWRVPLSLLPLETAFVLGWLAWRGAAPALTRWFVAVTAGVALAAFSFEYLRASTFAASPILLTACAAGVTGALIEASPTFARRSGRIPLAAALVAAAWLGGPAIAPPGPLDQIAALIPARLAALLRQPVSVAPATAIQLGVEELSGAPLTALFGPGYLSALGLVWAGFGIAALVIALARRRRAPQPPDPAWALLTWLSLALFAGTVLFARNKVVLAPLVAIGLGACWSEMAPSGAASRSARARGTAAALVFAFAITAWHAGALAWSRSSRLDESGRAALAWLRNRPGAVLALWSSGYELQAYAGRPTAADGLLESPLVRRRILETANAAMTDSPDSLASLMRRCGATDLLVPPSSQLLGVARLAGSPLARKLERRAPLRPDEVSGTLMRMMVYGKDEPPLVKAFESGLWRVYHLEEPAPR